jgi:HAMP domain-containing protein
MNRFLKVLKYLGLGVVALVAIALILVALANWMADARLERKVTALRDAGQPVTLVDLIRKPIPPETNAATYLRRARNDVEAIQKEVTAAIDAAPQLDQDRFDEGHLSPELKKAIQSAFEAYPMVIGLVTQAAECPDYDPQPDLTTDTSAFFESWLDESQSITRAVLRVLNYHALQQVSDSQQEEALRTCLLMFRLCRHFDREPMMNGYLVAVACRGGYAASTANLALRAGPLSDAARDALDAELARHETVEPFEHALITERAFGVQRYRELGHEISFGPIGPPWLKRDACSYLDLLEEAITLSGLSYAKADQALATSSAVANAGPLTRLIVPALQAMIDATCRVQAQMRCLRVLNALTRHDQSDNAPELKLTDLGLPAEATTDPFDGKPLHLKKLPDGWLIYSVGKNLTDDGGELTDDKDVGLGPPSAKIAEKKPDESKPADKAR